MSEMLHMLLAWGRLSHNIVSPAQLASISPPKSRHSLCCPKSIIFKAETRDASQRTHQPAHGRANWSSRFGGISHFRPAIFIIATRRSHGRLNIVGPVDRPYGAAIITFYELAMNWRKKEPSHNICLNWVPGRCVCVLSEVRWWVVPIGRRHHRALMQLQFTVMGSVFPPPASSTDHWLLAGHWIYSGS